MFIDPVCGMTVKPESPHETVLEGVTQRFCSAKCKAKFEADPAPQTEPLPVSEDELLREYTGPTPCMP